MAAIQSAAGGCRGWKARLDLTFEARPTATVLTENRHSGPLRLQRPFYPEEGVCHAYVLHPPGGVVGGDRLTLNAVVGENAAALITTPGAAKFYRSPTDEAGQENILTVAAGGALEWLPQETIIFPGARARTTTCIRLDRKAAFMGWEILCLGLPACDQPFRHGRADAALEIYRNGEPIFKDRLRVDGESGLNRPAGLRGFSVCGTFLAAGCREEMLAPLRQSADEASHCLLGITLLEDLLVARYLGNASLEAKAVFQNLWTRLRPHLTGRMACPPRIWST